MFSKPPSKVSSNPVANADLLKAFRDNTLAVRLNIVICGFLEFLFVIFLVADSAGKYAGDIPWSTRTFVTSISAILLALLGVGNYLSWIQRAHSNLVKLGVHEPKTRPGMAVLNYLIPGRNLVAPFMAMAELWNASKSPLSWKERRKPPLIVVWWCSVVLCPLFMDQVLAFAQTYSMRGDLVTPLFIFFTGVIPSHVLTWKLVGNICRFQVEAAANIERGEASPYPREQE